MSLVEEIIAGKDSKALCLTVIGNDFKGYFERVSLPHFKLYCEKYGLGLLILTDYIDKKKQHISPYREIPNTQRLLIPQIILSEFSQYNFICDIDVDCIPGPMARNIFSIADEGNLREDTIYVAKPVPDGYTRSNLGKRLSMLRKTFHDNTFPLDSGIIGDDGFWRKTYSLNFSGPVATMGLSMGSTQLMFRYFKRVYQTIEIENHGYLDFLMNQICREEAKVSWLPYEFRAIWNYEMALYYPFLFSSELEHLAYDCVMATLLRVDILHFAGNWPENNVFKKGPFLKAGSWEEYYKELPVGPPTQRRL